ncbi:Protein POF1B [Triplophysa tibetana]|uniref:Protein POF1B n=1 Tax=Triplophysa tibetana TaxID=1572043 RepID=A0A5A9PEJ7_9TELE|nr:Protein POF1B [Triplophysa tibetana]
MNVAEQTSPNVLTSPTILSSPVGYGEGTTTYRTVNYTGAQMQPVQYINSGMEGNMMYGGARYLVPVQQRAAEQQVVYYSQAPRYVQPMYLQNVQSVQNLQPVNISSVDTDYRQITLNGQSSSVVSHTSSPVKSPEHSEIDLEESSSHYEETVEYDGTSSMNTHVTEFIESEPVAKMDNRFFGELLAEVYRKNIDIHTCISEHVSKIRGRKHLLDPTIDYKVEKEEIEALIPKGVSELTKQQIRYLLQTRLTADKAMRLLLTTFSSLREELVHLQDDLRRLESEKEELERDLSFKADQGMQYDKLLETVREHNRQLQASLKESNYAQRSLETQLMMFQSRDPGKDFQIKELEGSRIALEHENELLRKKLAGQCSSSTVQIKTQEMTKHYEQMLNDLREEKERELKSLRSQVIKIQSERTITHTTDTSGLEMRIRELLTSMEKHETTIRHQEEEIKRLKQQKSDSSSSTRTVVTKRYDTQYPILGLLSDDYKYTPPIKEGRTVVIETTGQSTKREGTTLRDRAISDVIQRAFADALLAINKNFIHSQEVHLQWERLKALRTTGNEPLAGGQLGYSEGPAARPIIELRSLNGIRILYPQTISSNYAMARRGDRERVFVLRVWDVFCISMCVRDQAVRGGNERGAGISSDRIQMVVFMQLSGTGHEDEGARLVIWRNKLGLSAWG